MSEILQPSSSSLTDIFTDEIIAKMERRIYWALISGMFGLTLYFLLNLNPIIMFCIILGIGFLNPDDIVRGKFL